MALVYGDKRSEEMIQGEKVCACVKERHRILKGTLLHFRYWRPCRRRRVIRAVPTGFVEFPDYLKSTGR